MDESRLTTLLHNVSDGSLSVESALTQLRGLPYEAVGDFATLDHHRALRSGFPETIYCESKTPEQVAAIAERLAGSVLAFEESEAFAARASRLFSELGLANACAAAGDLATGPAQGGPFDVILVNGAIEQRPEKLLALLADGGRLLAVESGAGGARGAARFALYARAGDAISARTLFGAAAEPLAAFVEPPRFVF